MKSPFPGMDPYLELHWRDVHTSLMIYARDEIQAQLPPDLLARVEEGLSIDAEEDHRRVYPDVRVVEDQQTPFSANGGGASVAVAEPLVVVNDEDPTERHIEIIDPASGGRVVTVIEFLSPKNKRNPEGRLAYRRKQRDYVAARINLVEIDLIRGGDFVLTAQDDQIAADRRRTYMMSVRRITDPGMAAIYGASLREPLPRLPIPLRPKDRDIALDLQHLIDQCYERGRYFKIDYRHVLQPPLSSADAEWAEQRLKDWRM